MADAITVEGSDAGVAWRATVVSNDVDTIFWELRLDPSRPHRKRFVASSGLGSASDGGIFSTWPLGQHGPRWVIIVLSRDVQTVTVRYDDGLARSISPVRIGTRRVPQLGILSVTSHPAHLDLHGAGGHRIATLPLIDPSLRRDGQPRDLIAPAPIGPVTRYLGM